MRTTVRLDDDLLQEAKAHAARTGRSLTRLLEDALRTFLTLDRRPRRRSAGKLPTYGSGGLRPGVDLDDTAALYEVMERPGATRRR